jgi:hypothetical protein
MKKSLVFATALAAIALTPQTAKQRLVVKNGSADPKLPDGTNNTDNGGGSGSIAMSHEDVSPISIKSREGWDGITADRPYRSQRSGALA